MCIFRKNPGSQVLYNLWQSAWGTYDEDSDIDIKIDVSGTDNGFFIQKLPELFAGECEIVFYDYAPSLAPEKHILSIAIIPDASPCF